MASYTLEDVMYGDKYGIESAVLDEVFRMVQQGMPAKEIKEKLNIPIVTNYKDSDDFVLKFELKITILYLNIIKRPDLIKEELKSIPIKVDY